MSADEVDDCLATVTQPKRETLETLRRTILEIVPDAEQVISYRIPAFRVHGKVVAGFAAFNEHLSYLPFSGSVLDQLCAFPSRPTAAEEARRRPDRSAPPRNSPTSALTALTAPSGTRVTVWRTPVGALNEGAG
jgi:hypothetical protein